MPERRRCRLRLGHDLPGVATEDLAGAIGGDLVDRHAALVKQPRSPNAWAIISQASSRTVDADPGATFLGNPEGRNADGLPEMHPNPRCSQRFPFLWG